MNDERTIEDLNKQIEQLRMRAAGADFLSEGKQAIFELFVTISDEFDGSDYQQGKKDGLRCAMALLGNPEWLQFNRGNGGERNLLQNREPGASDE